MHINLHFFTADICFFFWAFFENIWFIYILKISYILICVCISCMFKLINPWGSSFWQTYLSLHSWHS